MTSFANPSVPWFYQIFNPSFDALNQDNDIPTIHDLLGHKNLQTTMICTHLMNKGPLGVKSPGDTL